MSVNLDAEPTVRPPWDEGVAVDAKEMGETRGGNDIVDGRVIAGGAVWKYGSGSNIGVVEELLDAFGWEIPIRGDEEIATYVAFAGGDVVGGLLRKGVDDT